MQKQQYFYANVALITKLIFCLNIFTIIDNKYNNKYFVFEQYFDCCNNKQVACVKLCNYKSFLQVYCRNKNIKNIRLFCLFNIEIDLLNI